MDLKNKQILKIYDNLNVLYEYDDNLRDVLDEIQKNAEELLQQSEFKKISCSRCKKMKDCPIQIQESHVRKYYETDEEFFAWFTCAFAE